MFEGILFHSLSTIKKVLLHCDSCIPKKSQVIGNCVNGERGSGDRVTDHNNQLVFPVEFSKINDYLIAIFSFVMQAENTKSCMLLCSIQL